MQKKEKITCRSWNNYNNISIWDGFLVRVQLVFSKVRSFGHDLVVAELNIVCEQEAATNDTVL